ncbi:MAG: hypothetical protein PHC28_13890 [Flavobacterium sp.]|uniref:hypothetical protein n=1 Tax=Flavobacterium sp. TaxID=239 RepID=UPI00261021C7|nr:hypothetical protein [Flavobacterium sp.]MDD5151545.1 hypothetical protein [Flavobacterium sp.]
MVPHYRDLDLTLTIHPLTGDISDKFDDNAIKRSLRNLFQLNAWDIPFDQNKHNSLKEYLFDIPSPITAAMIEKKLIWLVRTCEPRVTVTNINIEPLLDNSGYIINLSYEINDLNLIDNYTHFLKRNFE